MLQQRYKVADGNETLVSIVFFFFGGASYFLLFIDNFLQFIILSGLTLILHTYLCLKS